MRFSMTARTLAHQRREDLPETDITRRNVEKVTRFRKDGLSELEKLAGFFESAVDRESRVRAPTKRNVYPDMNKEKPAKARHNPVGPN
jgi:hypothetical protein